ncbi:MAG: iron ABC transporter permease [Chloroflexota bacterium]|nr:iron ABC transporter permease [Chloroflexota bacterium]
MSASAAVSREPRGSAVNGRRALARRPLLFACLIAVLIAAIALSLSLGSVDIPLSDIVRALTGGEASRDAWTNIVLRFRLPKVLTAALAGAALSVGGLLMQTLFRNPLADPFVLGISSGASLGVALVILAIGAPGVALLAGFGLAGDLGIAAAASIGAGLVMLLVLLIASRIRDRVALLIVGLMLGYAVGALVSLLLFFSIPERIQAFINWGFGSFGGVTWGQMPIFAPIVIGGLLLCATLAKPLNALLLGESYAASLGVRLGRVRLAIIVGVGLMAGAVTAFCGPIGFLGIAAPHLARSLFGTSDHRITIPAALIVGALLAIAADLIAQAPGSRTVLPLNAVTALFGAPVVILAILRWRGLRASFE